VTGAPSRQTTPMHRRLVCTLLLAAAVTPAAARADDRSAAAALFESARAAMDRGDLASACPQFAESARLEPGVGTLLNWGECERRSGELASALSHFQMARPKLSEGDFRLSFADERIASLLPRVAHLTLRPPATPFEGLRVECDGGAEPSSTAIPMDPGPHVCVIHAPAHDDTSVRFVLAAGENKVIDLAVGPSTLGAAGGAGSGSESLPGNAPPSPPPPSPADTTRGGTQRLIGLVVGGSGAVALGIGAVFGVVAKVTYDSAASECPQGTHAPCPPQAVTDGARAHNQAAVSTGAFIAGGALVVVGASIYLMAPKGQTIALVPGVGGRSGSVVWGGQF
jgi:hypothetical protein